MRENTKCETIKNCYSCNSCNSCYSCNYCDYCNSCNSCYSCNYCDYCNYCNYCDSCNSCDYCNYCNYCDYSSGLRMSERMLFCLGDGRYSTKGEGYQKNNRIFNVQVTEDEWTKARNSRPSFELPIAKWIDKKDMTDDEKENHEVYKEIGGYLKTLSYQDAWKEGWSKASDEFKKWVKALPNFDSVLFKKITGLDIEETLVGTIAEVKIGGKTYKAKIID